MPSLSPVSLHLFFILVSTPMLFSILVEPTEGNGVSYFLEGYRFASPSSLLDTHVAPKMTMAYCSIVCNMDPDCITANVKPGLGGTCEIYSAFVYEASSSFTHDSEWSVLYKSFNEVQHEEGTLVLRIEGQKGILFHDAFPSTKNSDDPFVRGSVPVGCFRKDTYLPCDQFFRSRLLSNQLWPLVQSVRLTLYDSGGSMLNYIVFDAFNSSFDGWFSRDRILNSSWSNITFDSGSEQFELDLDDGRDRRLLIHNEYDGCSDDAGYLVVVEKEPDDCQCEWGLCGNNPSATAVPLLIYSPIEGAVTWSNVVTSLADVLMIHVQLYDLA